MKLRFLQNEIVHQDQLLQSYRFYFHISQAGFAICGVLLCIGLLALNDAQAFLCVFLLLVLSTLAFLAGKLTLSSILSRTKDVDYWQNELLKYEQAELREKDRLLTHFKLAQKSRSKIAPPPGLLEKTKGHTRRSLDQKIPKLLIIFWSALWLVVMIRLLLL